MLVDVNRLPGLDHIDDSDGHLRGCTGPPQRRRRAGRRRARQHTMAAAAPWISDPLVRNLGRSADRSRTPTRSVTGVSHAGMRRRSRGRSTSGERVIPMAGFITGPFTTVLEPRSSSRRCAPRIRGQRRGLLQARAQGRRLRDRRRRDAPRSGRQRHDHHGRDRSHLGRAEQHQGRRGRTGAGRPDAERRAVRRGGRARRPRRRAQGRRARVGGVQAPGRAGFHTAGPDHGPRARGVGGDR